MLLLDRLFPSFPFADPLSLSLFLFLINNYRSGSYAYTLRTVTWRIYPLYAMTMP